MANFVVSGTPHVRSKESIQSIMRDVIIALIPATAMGIYFFGIPALILIAVSIVASVFFEWLYQKLLKKPVTISDLSAVVTGLLLAMNLLLLFLGCFLETQSIILLVTPILLPMASYIGLSEIALGLIMIVNTSIGMITPPMAVNLFVASGITKTRIGSVSKKIVLYLVVEFGILLLYTYVPLLLNIPI